MVDHEEDFDNPERGHVDLTPEQIAAAEKEKALLLAGVKDTAERQADIVGTAPRADRVSSKAGDGDWPDQRAPRARAVAQPKPARRAAAVPVRGTKPQVIVEDDILAPWTLEEAMENVATTKAAYLEAKRILVELL